MSLKSRIRPLLSRRAVRHRIVGGPLRGARIVTSWHDYPAGILGLTERGLLAWFAGHVIPGETWLDVGAHYGYTAIALSRLVGASGRVFAFEPVAATAGCLVETKRVNGLAQTTVVACGLGSPATVEFVRRPLERGMADGPFGDEVGREWNVIQVARFDWLWPLLNNGIDAVDGVKIDVQGMEVEALRGMADLLRRQQPKLVIELHAGVGRDTVLDLLAAAGYPGRGCAVDHGAAADLADDRSYAFVAPLSTAPAAGR